MNIHTYVLSILTYALYFKVGENVCTYVGFCAYIHTSKQPQNCIEIGRGNDKTTTSNAAINHNKGTMNIWQICIVKLQKRGSSSIIHQSQIKLVVIGINLHQPCLWQLNLVRRRSAATPQICMFVNIELYVYLHIYMYICISMYVLQKLYINTNICICIS